MKLIRSLLISAFGMLSTLVPATMFAQSFPSKPIELICPYPPGGSTDIAARAIGAEMSKVLQKTVVVVNRAGAAGNVGSEAAARSNPDGYTMLLSTGSTHGITPFLYSKLNYDPNKDLEPVMALASFGNVLVVHPSVEANSIAEIIELAKAQPGELTFASSGIGTTMHMSGELFNYLADVEMLHVPYKGSGPAITDLLAGHVDIMFDNIPSAMPHINSGKLRALGVTGLERDFMLPDVPTISEAGLPGYEVVVWNGISVPAGTPRETIDTLNRAAQEGVKSPEFVKSMEALGAKIIGGTPGHMRELINADLERWGPIVKESIGTID